MRVGFVGPARTQNCGVSGNLTRTEMSLVGLSVFAVAQAFAGDLAAVTTWLNRILANMKRPRHVGAYSKSTDGMGLLWVKFRSLASRDIVVGLIRSAAMKMGPNNVWATQDFPVPVKARKLFLMGFRWQLIQ